MEDENLKGFNNFHIYNTDFSVRQVSYKTLMVQCVGECLRYTIYLSSENARIETLI